MDDFPDEFVISRNFEHGTATYTSASIKTVFWTLAILPAPERESRNDILFIHHRRLLIIKIKRKRLYRGPNSDTGAAGAGALNRDRQKCRCDMWKLIHTYAKGTKNERNLDEQHKYIFLLFFFRFFVCLWLRWKSYITMVLRQTHSPREQKMHANCKKCVFSPVVLFVYVFFHRGECCVPSTKNHIVLANYWNNHATILLLPNRSRFPNNNPRAHTARKISFTFERRAKIAY